MESYWERIKEEKEKMCDALRELFAEELEECRERGLEEERREGRLEGILAGQQEGLELAKKIFKLSAAGMSLEDISKQCEIPVGRVKEILD